jgi:hypothetical protein
MVQTCILILWKRGEGKGGRIWLRNFVDTYEYGTLKPVKVIARRGVGKEGE